MSRHPNPISRTFSEVAEQYDDLGNVRSCWTVHANKIRATLRVKDTHRTVVDVGCGTGTALVELASQSPSAAVRFIGVEPAAGMRRRARALTKHLANVSIVDGAFEQLPLEPSSVDYLFSIDAFHWVSDMSRAITELARALKPSGEMDLFFNGCNNGRDFVRATTPVYSKYMGLRELVAAAKLRHQLPRDEAAALFGRAFGRDRVVADEVYATYYDTVEGHLGWQVRVAPQLLAIPAERREECDRELRAALAAIQTDQGVPYTIHQVRVRVEPTR